MPTMMMSLQSITSDLKLSRDLQSHIAFRSCCSSCKFPHWKQTNPCNNASNKAATYVMCMTSYALSLCHNILEYLTSTGETQTEPRLSYYTLHHQREESFFRSNDQRSITILIKNEIMDENTLKTQEMKK